VVGLFLAECGRGCKNVWVPRTDAERGGSVREIGLATVPRAVLFMGTRGVYTGAAGQALLKKITVVFSTLRP
jgi:hypothetical protein